MHFLFVIWQRTKSILLFALIYLAVGVDCETFFLSKQSALVKQGISSPVSHQVESTQTFFEETEEADNEVLYFQECFVLLCISRDLFECFLISNYQL